MQLLKLILLEVLSLIASPSDSLLTVSGCKCSQISNQADCENENLFCKWDRVSLMCSLKSCDLRTKDNCNPSSIFTNEEEYLACYFD